ncbi:hypothetical protein OG417_45090 [Actinoallomurus sp. NBC_01490]|uniref:hypothetical protein n=1 Tax=Actinoallomurus sp. NBC_01490 TaxID=2903557 RepID=UPI002E315E16|nr:hypothetical protein [Actinoallomurus sp. NBC_01490]
MSHAQALLARLANAISALAREVPAPPAETFAQAVELLQSGQRALSRADVNAPAQSDDPGWWVPDSQGSPQPGGHASHPDLDAWLTSSADMVTGEADRRRVPIRDLLTAGEFFVRTAGRPVIVLAAGEDGVSIVDVGTVSRGDELRSRIAEALYLVSAEATMWSPRARAQAMALVRFAEDELAERCQR